MKFAHVIFYINIRNAAERKLKDINKSINKSNNKVKKFIHCQ